MHFLVYFILLCILTSQTKPTQIAYKLAARNLPPEKNPFAEIKNKPGHDCRTNTIEETQNPNWATTCYVNFDSYNTELKFEIRHHRANLNDQSLGFVYVFVKNMLNVRKTHSEEIWDEENKYWVGTLLITPQSVIYTHEHLTNASNF